MNYDTWNPYEDVECIEAFVESVEEWYTEWCEEHDIDPKEWASKTHYTEDHKDAFEEFSYTFWEDSMLDVAEKNLEERDEK
jgi:hypothetical protein